MKGTLVHETEGPATRRYYGKYAGIVLENEKPDGGDHRGQLKVRVPGILEDAPGDTGERQPIDVIAAPSFLPGFFFIPAKNDNVWVEFVAGDINFPIWTGVWYPNEKTPKDAEGGAPTEHTKVIRTPSGQVIALEDTGGGERIVLRDEANDNTITVDKGGIKIEGKPSGGSISLVFGNSTVTLSSDGVEIAHGANKVTLSSAGVEIKGPTQTLEMGATGTKLAGSPIVLEPLIQWLMSHTHIGNMGAPTPLLPPQAPLLKVPGIVSSP